MAYPTRGRDPFLDAGTQAFLERRGVEALGLFVSAVGRGLCPGFGQLCT